jgi:putative tryptophan/tyrosine transport system substrate-binding protein
MRRRHFICALLFGSVTWSLTAHAQQSAQVKRIGVLMAVSPDATQQTDVSAFEQALNDLGWRVGTNLLVEIRWASGNYGRMLTDARELVRLEPNAILVAGAAFPSAVRATQTIPIVFVLASDAMAQAYVKSFARPNGNATGFTSYELSLVSKRLELMKEIAPSVNRVAFIHNPMNRSTQEQLQHLVQASPSLSVKVADAPVENNQEIEQVVKVCASEQNCALVIAFDAFTTAHSKKIIQLAAQYRLPAIYPFDLFAKAGGLLSYGIDRVDQYRHAASYVDRILKGTKVSDLPVQAASKFKLTINLKTAKALGVTIPPSLVARADEVIE